MKRIIAIFLILIITVCPLTIYAQGVSVYLNDSRLYFDVQPQIINGRTMVPMRKIFESLGAVVTWDDASQTATGKKGDIIVNISIDSKTLFKNGVPKLLDVAPMLIDSRTLVPVRAIAESFDCNVEWIAETQTVKISTDGSYSLDKTKLTASEISDKVSPSVFYIEVYDEYNYAMASGSGFFITSDGLAVTNYHVIKDTSSAIITTTNSERYNVTNIIAFDEKLDVAIIRIDKTSISGKSISGFPAITKADSDNIKTGQTVYALGSPVGLQNTISNGIISNSKQVLDGDTFIQITAPISHGSSGGALVNEYGEVIGITSSGIDDAQNIGFAIPINIINLFDLNAIGTSYEEFAMNSNQFTLEVYPETLELYVGDSYDIFVYADGKGDNWSIYWDTPDEQLVYCIWGDWLKENNSVCTLNVTAKEAGTATITIYSDVDFKGKEIIVYIKNQPVQTYFGTTIPTYTYVTDIPVIDTKTYDNSYLYIYDYYSITPVQNYMNFLTQRGFKYYDSTNSDGTTSYYYITPQDDLINIAIAYKWNEVWIYIPR